MAFECRTQTACEYRFLAALQLCTDCIETDAGQGCDKYEAPDHREHDPLAATKPGQQGYGADQDGDGKTVYEALLGRPDQIGDAEPNPAKRCPRGKLAAGCDKRHFFALDVTGARFAHR